MHQTIVGGLAGNTFNLVVDKLALGLRIESWVGQLDTNYGHQAFTDIVARNIRVLILQYIVVLGVLINRTG